MESGRTAFTLPVLLAVSFSHLLNDTIQAVIPAIYPLLKTHFTLDFVQVVDFITLALQLIASILQPLVGLYADRHPRPTRSPSPTRFIDSIRLFLPYYNPQ